MYWSRRMYLSWPYVFKPSLRHFQDVFKTSSRHLAKTSSRRLAKTSSRHLQEVLPRLLEYILKHLQTSSRRIAKMSWRHLQDVLKTLIKLKFLLTRLRNLWSVYKIFKSEPFGYTETRKTICLKHFMKWLILQTNIFLLMLGTSE